MTGYGQFCSIAKALEVVGERWTLLILRELICGAARFSEIQRGLPRLSPSLLAKRLAALEAGGVIRHEAGGYRLTEAGAELRPVVEALGIWGQRWVRGQLTPEDFDPDLLMWDMRRRIALDRLPAGRLCVAFGFPDAPPGKRAYWLLLSPEAADLCISDPGVEPDLWVTTSLQLMVRIWNGDLPLAPRIADGSVELSGPRTLCAAFPGWLQLGAFAGVAAARPAQAGAASANGRSRLGRKAASSPIAGRKAQTR